LLRADATMRTRPNSATTFPKSRSSSEAVQLAPWAIRCHRSSKIFATRRARRRTRLVIGRTCSHLNDQEDPLSYVLGYTCVNDVTARDLQRVTRSSPAPKASTPFVRSDRTSNLSCTQRICLWKLWSTVSSASPAELPSWFFPLSF
jgi:hypothetical protein